MTIKTEAFDPAEFLDTPEAVAEYLAAAFESDDHAVIADALGVAICHAHHRASRLAWGVGTRMA